MLRTPLAAHHVFVAKLVSDGPTFFAARLIAGDGDSAAQVGGDEPGRGVLPAMQRALWDLGDQPLPGLPGGRIQTGGGRVLRICAHTDDVWEVQRVVVAPLLGGTEVATVAWLEPRYAVGENGLEFIGPL